MGAGLARRVLEREVEERRFFSWIPVAAMGGVALNLSADREPVLWLPALMTALFATIAGFSRSPARPCGAASMKPQANAAVESIIREGLILTSIIGRRGQAKRPCKTEVKTSMQRFSNAML